MTAKPPADPRAQREARLAAALRGNLRRRKASEAEKKPEPVREEG